MNRGDLEPYKSYVNINMFYFIYAGIVGIYTILGGLFAAVVTDVVQGLLIVFLSLALIPMGLSRLGGFEACIAQCRITCFSSLLGQRQ